MRHKKKLAINKNTIKNISWKDPLPKKKDNEVRSASKIHLLSQPGQFSSKTSKLDTLWESRTMTKAMRDNFIWLATARRYKAEFVCMISQEKT